MKYLKLSLAQLQQCCFGLLFEFSLTHGRTTLTSQHEIAFGASNRKQCALFEEKALYFQRQQ